MKRREVLEKKLEEAKAKLQKERGFNKAAWDTYGSELCAPEMIDNEQKIAKEILHLQKLLKMSEVDMSIEALLCCATEINAEIAAVQREIDDLTERQRSLNEQNQYRKAYLKRIEELKLTPLDM